MTETVIRDRLKELADLKRAFQDDRARRVEDDLWHDVLDAIAFGKLQDVTLEQAAWLALQSRRVHFPRWTA